MAPAIGNGSPDMVWDYIFVGGGLCASVTSNRLLKHDPTLNILIIEAGANANNDPSVIYPNTTNRIGGQYDWKYKTVPQVHLDGRVIDLPCGKAVGGGSVINTCNHPTTLSSVQAQVFVLDLHARYANSAHTDIISRCVESRCPKRL